MALIDTNKLPRVPNFEEQQRQAQTQVKNNPFGNLGLGAMKVEQDPNYGVKQSFGYQNQQSQQRPVNNTQQQNIQQNRTQTYNQPQRPVQQPKTHYSTGNNYVRTTANGNTLKRTPSGNTYTYNDVYDHSRDVDIKNAEKFILRIPASFKATLQEEAKIKHLSLNQYILQILEEHLGRR